MTSSAKQQLAFRIRPRTLQALRRRARDLGQTQTAVAERYIEEGIRTDEHQLIYFREGAAGRRPALIGTRLDVWQVVETVRQSEGDIEAAGAYLDLPVGKLHGALRYYGEYREEVDAWIERAQAFADREEAAWRRSQTID